jgi:hypothetical protein
MPQCPDVGQARFDHRIPARILIHVATFFIVRGMTPSISAGISTMCTLVIKYIMCSLQETCGFIVLSRRKQLVGRTLIIFIIFEMDEFFADPCAYASLFSCSDWERGRGMPCLDQACRRGLDDSLIRLERTRCMHAPLTACHDALKPMETCLVQDC